MGLFNNIFSSKDEISQDEFLSMLKADKKVKVIDVRNAMEYRAEHLAPSINMDVREDSFTDKLKFYERKETYLLYCKSGSRSSKAASKMKKMGFDQVYSLKGGITDWDGSKRLK